MDRGTTEVRLGFFGKILATPFRCEVRRGVAGSRYVVLGLFGLEFTIAILNSTRR